MEREAEHGTARAVLCLCTGVFDVAFDGRMARVHLSMLITMVHMSMSPGGGRAPQTKVEPTMS